MDVSGGGSNPLVGVLITLLILFLLVVSVLVFLLRNKKYVSAKLTTLFECRLCGFKVQIRILKDYAAE